MLKGKKILLGVTGGIAAYKCPLLVRELKRAGADVRVVMSPSAETFVTRETLSVVSGHPVLSTWFSESDHTWNNHIDLGTDPDLFFVAPATANTIAAFAHGRCENLLQAIYLSARCPVIIAPAMDHDMFHHPATVDNIQILKNRGVSVIQPETGELASGIYGDGRLPEPEQLAGYIHDFFNRALTLSGKKVLITSGPTHESIDQVRFIGNHSSGKMGTALAREAAKRGAEVVVVSGPAKVIPREPGILVKKVGSAREMFLETEKEFSHADIVIFAAAVADFTPEHTTEGKIKKENTGELILKLVKTTDIAGTLSPRKKDGQITIGFALETENEEQNALDKLRRKQFDFIILNSANDSGAGFDVDTNSVNIYSGDNKIWTSGLRSKEEIARGIFDQVNKIQGVEV